MGHLYVKSLYKYYFPGSIDFLKLKLDSKSRLPIPEFSGYHCINQKQLLNQQILEK